MSHATLPSPAPSWKAAFHRFAWKEYRCLRGFWLAMAGLAVAEQCVSKLLWMPGQDLPLWLFSSALGAAALYGIGASAVLFSNEHEEETYRFLSVLPTNWQPVYLGKLAVAAATSLLLALVLIATGGVLAGGRLPLDDHAGDVAVVLGFGIVEGIAWGTLCSLRFKQPLVAALLAITSATVVTQLVVSTVGTGHTQTLQMASYREALPMRLAVVILVLAVGVWQARRWLPQNAADHVDRRQAGRARWWQRTGSRDTTAQKFRGPAMLLRLLWQSWRETKWLLLLPLMVTVALWFCIAAVGGLARLRWEVAGLVACWSLFLLPVLYGAFAFYTDQRQARFRFFAQRGIAAGRIWLVRNATWFAAFCAVSMLLMLILGVVAAWSLFQDWSLNYQQYSSLNNRTFDGYFSRSAHHVVGQLLAGVQTVFAAGGKVLLAPLAAYALGQFCSLLVRSQILAAFLAIVLSTVLAAWMLVVFAWQLNAWLFVLPIILGLLTATWLRAPDWLVERHSLGGWLKPLLAAAIPLVLMGLYLPEYRLGQIPGLEFAEAEQRLAAVDAKHEPPQAASETAATSAVYEQAIAENTTPLANDPLEAWYRDHPLDGPGTDEVDSRIEAGFAIDKNLVPEEQRDSYIQAKQEQRRRIREKQQATLDLVVEAADMADCTFDFQPGRTATTSEYTPGIYGHHYVRWQFTDQRYNQFGDLLDLVAHFADQPREFFAGLVLANRLRTGQPAFIFIDQLHQEKALLAALAAWLQEPDRTAEELQEATQAMREFSRSWPSPEAAVKADLRLVKQTIQGELPPLLFGQEPIPIRHHLAWLANQAPWERSRALRALDLLAAFDLVRIESVYEVLDRRTSSIVTQTLGETLRARIPTARPGEIRYTSRAIRTARTSHLARLEYRCRVEISSFLEELVNAEVRRRAMRLQLAMARYALDHDEYPVALNELVPDYIALEPLDPYTGGSFQYEQGGFQLPIRYQDRGRPMEEPAETPLVWSPGLGQATFVETSQYVSVDSEDPDAEPEREPVLLFRNSDPIFGWTNIDNLVFPLREPPQATEAAGSETDRP